MNNRLEHRYCQSCGMPLNLLRKEWLGTNSDKSSSDEYCHYCLKDGKYTVDFSIQQMVDEWVTHTDQYNGYANTHYTPEHLSSVLNERIPQLKRYKQKKETENIHFEIVNRIQIYINQHLFDELETGQLCKLAGLSLFHFRRIFKTITGENIGTYIQRLRLEYIAYRLISTDLPVVDIINKISVYNKSSLSKAFKKQFGTNPSEYRAKNSLLNISDKAPISENKLNPTITRLNNVQVTCLQVQSQLMDMRIYRNLWRKLMNFTAENNLIDQKNKFVSISLDEPFITNPDNCRYYLGVINNNFSDASGQFTVVNIPNGLYAIFRHKGRHKLLPDFYRNIYLNWLPDSGYQQSEPLTFEVYINTPREVPQESLETDVYIPVRKI